MKECCRCNVAKDLSLFYKNKRSSDGHAYHCKECHNKTTIQWQQENPERASDINNIAQVKRRTQKAQTQREYYLNNKDYYKQKSVEYRAKYPEKFVGRLRKQKIDPDYSREYRAKNKDLIKFHRKKRKALIRGSIVNFSKDDYDSVLERFEYKCAISGSSDIHMDHFIPISTGYGDTTIGNMIPLDAKLNLSKSASNPFEWIKTRSDIDRKRFEDVVFYLAEMNGLTTDEFEAHVYNCF